MREIFINKLKACAVTGHRELQKDIDVDKIESLFNQLIDHDFNTFLIGMALGFDTLCFHILEKIRRERKIKIIACIPCKNQDYKYTDYQKKEYARMISVADEKIVLSEQYTPYCMLNRNKFMVDNCSVLIAYLRKDKGGTKYTVNYAQKQNVSILEV